MNYCLIDNIVYLSKFINNAEPRLTQWVFGKCGVLRLTSTTNDG
jgi:hypothetical protein